MHHNNNTSIQGQLPDTALAIRYNGLHTLSLDSYKPVLPKPGEVTLRVAYCGLCGSDRHIYHGQMDNRIDPPQVIGHEMSGVIVAVGDGVSDFHIGERGVVRPLFPCGECPACQAGHFHICQNLNFFGIESPGALQQYWTVPASTVHRLPDNVTMEEGALVEPLAVACHDVRLAGVSKGESVVVLGGGPIGLLIALVARKAGASVMLSEVNATRSALAASLGFPVFNPLQVDMPQLVKDRTGGAGADVIFEVTSSPNAAITMTELARTHGRITIVGIFGAPAPVDLHQVFLRELHVLGARVYEPQDFEMALKLLATRSLGVDALISARFPLASVPEVFARLDTEASWMKVLIAVNECETSVAAPDQQI